MSTATKHLVGAVAATSLLLAACSKDVSGKDGPLVVDKTLLSAEVQAQLTKGLGKQAPPVKCPDDLDASYGATTTCLMNAPDGTYNVTVTVTKLDWSGFGNFGVGTAYFDTTIAAKPNP